MQAQLFEWAKSQGVSFVILCMIIYILYGKLEKTEARMDVKLDRMEAEVKACNQATQTLLIEQLKASSAAIEESNRWHQSRGR